MKKKYLKSMTITKLYLWLLFVSLPMLAMGQKQNSGGPAVSVTKQLRSGATPSIGTVKLNGGAVISWDEAMAQLQNGENTIELQSDVTFTTTPTKACIVTGADKTLTFSGVNDQLNLQAPITFKNIKLNILKIMAQGNALTFDEGVICLGNNNRINNIWAGGGNTDVAETNVTIKSGSFGWIYAGSGNTGKVESTHLTIEGGTIYGDIFGGSYAGECTTTNITIKGGTIKSAGVFGGGWNDKVGTTNITIVDGDLEGSVFGGGSGEGSEYSICENTNITVAGGSIGVRLYGGGSPGQVTGTAKIVVSGGSISGAIFGGGGQYNSVYDYYTTATCQNTDVTIGGVTLGNEGIFAGGDAGKVLGNAKLTFAGDILGDAKPTVYASGQWAASASAEIVLGYDLKEKLAGIAVNTDKTGSTVTNESKLTFKNLGTSGSAYNLPWKIAGFTTIALDNSYLKAETDANYFVSDLAKPTTFKGTGFTTPIKIDTKEATSDSEQVLFMAEERPESTIFTGVNNLSGKNIFRVNKTYHLTAKASDNWKTITITPTTGDTLIAKLDTTTLLSGDKIPTELELTIRAASQLNYATKVKNNNATLTSNTFTVTENALLTMEVTEYLDLAEQKQDVTIGLKNNKWQYQAQAITRSNEPPVYSFNGIVKNELEDGKTVVIDATAQGALTFENAKINSTTTVAPALTIASGAKVSFSGNLEVKAGEANQYGIMNNGSLTITGASTEITATNTTASSDKGIKVDAAASMVAEAGTKLTTSGMANTGTVVVKDGAIAQTAGGIALQKTYLVTIVNPGNGNKLVLKAGADIAVSDQDKVADKTVLTVSGVPASAYTLESITVTPKGGQATTLNNNSTYTMPESEVSFAATFKQQTPPEATYHSVTLPAVEGATTNPVAGIHQVESWSNFRFTLTLDEEYSQSTPIVTTSRGETILPSVSDGAYEVTYVREPVIISISGIVKNNPVGNVSVDADDTKVWNIGSTLYIQTLSKESVRIISFSGALLRQFIIPGGDYQTQMPEGLYIVQVGKNCFKVKM